MRQFFSIIVLIFFPFIMAAQQYTLESPSGKNKVNITVDKTISWSLISNGREKIAPSEVAMETSFGNWGRDAVILSHHEKSVLNTLHPVYYTSETVSESYKELSLHFEQGFTLIFRAYEEGVAYRFVGNQPGRMVVNNETATFAITGDPDVYYAETDGFQTPFEGKYDPSEKLSALQGREHSITPVLVRYDDGSSLLISESDLMSYPGMFLQATEDGFRGDFAPFVTRESVQLLGRISPVKAPYFSKMRVRKRAAFLAETTGNRNFPWRVVVTADKDAELIDNHLVWLLATPNRVADTDWIRPGKVAWDWYHYWILEDSTDFRQGINTETYKYYIDFAAENGFEYVNLDFGWSPLFDLSRWKRKVNVPEIIEYARQRDVGVFLWMVWYVLDEKMEETLDRFAEWGVSGLKVDFMDRDDQRVVEFCHRLAYEASERKLLVNLHGMYKPSGLCRTYPNVINREGVLGLENNKFNALCTPGHNLTIPFIRNAVGPMDYTPGAMRHVTEEEFDKNWRFPAAMTTRVHQMAMYVCYFGPLQMIADSPGLYPDEVLRFLEQVPTTWDETIVLEAKIGESLIVMRRKNDTWFIAGMNAGIAKEVDIAALLPKPVEFSSVSYWYDGASLDEVIEVPDAGSLFPVSVNSNGGFVIILNP